MKFAQSLSPVMRENETRFQNHTLAGMHAKVHYNWHRDGVLLNLYLQAYGRQVLQTKDHGAHGGSFAAAEHRYVIAD
jgi:hypothetical protein